MHLSIKNNFTLLLTILLTSTSLAAPDTQAILALNTMRAIWRIGSAFRSTADNMATATPREKPRILENFKNILSEMRLTSEVKNLIVKELDYRIEHHSAIKSVEESPDYLVNIYTWMPREERYRIYPQFDQYLESGRAGNIIHTIAPHIAENMHLELIVIPLHEQEIMRRFFVSELRKIKHTQRHIRNNNDMESLFGALENLTNYLKHSILCTLGEAEVETVETVLLREGWITELHAIMEIEARITSTSLSYSAEHNVGQGASANNSLACPVCCETYDNNNRPQVILACAGTRTNNSHHLCVNCFDEIQSRGKNQCPMCRHIPITARPFGD